MSSPANAPAHGPTNGVVASITAAAFPACNGAQPLNPASISAANPKIRIVDFLSLVDVSARFIVLRLGDGVTGRIAPRDGEDAQKGEGCQYPARRTAGQDQRDQLGNA